MPSHTHGDVSQARQLGGTIKQAGPRANRVDSHHAMAGLAENYQHQRGLVALNNVGVSMLVKGSFREAMHAFKGSIPVLKESLAVRAGESNELNHTKIDSLLGDMERSRLAPNSCRPFDLDRIRVEPISIFSEALTRAEVPTCTVHPIRLDDLENVDLDLDLKSAVLLHNLACSYVCLSRSGHVESEAHKLQQSAIDIFAMSHSILMAQRKGCDDEIELWKTLRVEIIVLGDSLQLVPSAAKRTKVKFLLECIHEMLQEMSIAEQVLLARTRTAPAA